MTTVTAHLVNCVSGSLAEFFYDSNYNFYVENLENGEYFFDKYFNLLEKVDVNCMNLESPWVKKMWKLDINWLDQIADTSQKLMPLGDLVLLNLPPISQNLLTSLQTWVAIDTNKNKVIALKQWGCWIKDGTILNDWLISLASN